MSYELISEVRLLEPIPKEKIDVTLKMSSIEMYGKAGGGFRGHHRKGYIGYYPNIDPVTADVVSATKRDSFYKYSIEHFTYFIIGFSVVKVIVTPEKETT